MSQQEKDCNINSSEETQFSLDYSETLVETGDSEEAEFLKFRKSLANFIVVDGHPFDMVEREGFIEMMSVCGLKFELPSALTLSQDCYQLYLDEKLKLEKFLGSNCNSVCLTLDSWSTNQGPSYMCITAHFIDEDWKLQRKILNFVPNSLSHGEEIEMCLLDWGIKKVVTVMNNFSSNDKAIVYLKDKLIESGRGFLECKYLQVECIARLVNLVVVEALEEAKLSVNRVRGVVRYVKFNRSTLKKFWKCVEDEKIESKERLYKDVGYIWNSTYVMLSRAEKYEKAFDRYAKIDQEFTLDYEDGLPSSVDWGIIRRLIVILRPFYEIILSISRSEFLTSNHFWGHISDLYGTFSGWENSEDLKLREAGNKMKVKLEEYFGGYEKTNKLVYIATVLDPRLKLEVLGFAFGQIYGEEKGKALLKNLKETMFDLFNEYKNMVEVEVNPADQSNEVFNQEYKNFFMVSYKKQKLGIEDKKSELDLYLDDPSEDDDTNDFDVLKWWKCNSNRFPIIARMARDILAIPKSTVRADFAFNIDKSVIYKWCRGDMDYEMVQALICAQDWLWKSPPYLDIVKEFEENEMIGEEFAEMSAEFGGFGLNSGGWSDSD